MGWFLNPKSVCSPILPLFVPLCHIYLCSMLCCICPSVHFWGLLYTHVAVQHTLMCCICPLLTISASPECPCPRAHYICASVPPMYFRLCTYLLSPPLCCGLAPGYLQEEERNAIHALNARLFSIIDPSLV